MLPALVLAGCATTAPPATTPPPVATSGLEQVMHKPAEVAIALLGPPSLDRREGPARQLQFAGACILDLFYFQNGNEPPLAVHGDARLPNGRDIAPGQCLQSLVKTRALVSPPAGQAAKHRPAHHAASGQPDPRK